jgi:hypothetical protein
LRIEANLLPYRQSPPALNVRMTPPSPPSQGIEGGIDGDKQEQKMKEIQ